MVEIEPEYTFPCTQDGCKGVVSKVPMRKLTIDSDGERWEDYDEWQCDYCEWTQRAAHG